jgi:hypothetical protein
LYKLISRNILFFFFSEISYYRDFIHLYLISSSKTCCPHLTHTRHFLPLTTHCTSLSSFNSLYLNSHTYISFTTHLTLFFLFYFFQNYPTTLTVPLLQPFFFLKTSSSYPTHTYTYFLTHSPTVQH